jgi:hypothetical protein
VEFRRRLEIFLILSLFLHVAMFALLAQLRHEPHTLPARETIALEIKTQPEISAAGSPSAEVRSGPRAKTLARRFRVNTFLPNIKYDMGGDLAAGSTQGDDPTARWGESNGNALGNLADYPLMRMVYERVNGNLYYPGVLANHKIQGMVNARLYVDEFGRCDWHRTTISAADPHLRVFILSVLKDACGQSFARAAVNKKKINIDLSFRFSITEHNDQDIVNEENRVGGHVLFFFRNSQHSIAEWHLGPFHGLFPIPFVAVDFAWLKEN